MRRLAIFTLITALGACSLDNGGTKPDNGTDSGTHDGGGTAGVSGAGNGGGGKAGNGGKAGSGGTAGSDGKPDKDASGPDPDKDSSTPSPTDAGLDAEVDAYVPPPPTPPAPPRLEAHLAGGNTGVSAHYVLYHSVGAPRPTNSLTPRGQSSSANYRLNTGLAAALPPSSP